jgi:hypothetical protein
LAPEKQSEDCLHMNIFVPIEGRPMSLSLKETTVAQIHFLESGFAVIHATRGRQRQRKNRACIYTHGKGCAEGGIKESGIIFVFRQSGKGQKRKEA